jgi:hypothetical protein
LQIDGRTHTALLPLVNSEPERMPGAVCTFNPVLTVLVVISIIAEDDVASRSASCTILLASVPRQILPAWLGDRSFEDRPKSEPGSEIDNPSSIRRGPGETFIASFQKDATHSDTTTGPVIETVITISYTACFNLSLPLFGIFLGQLLLIVLCQLFPNCHSNVARWKTSFNHQIEFPLTE